MRRLPTLVALSAAFFMAFSGVAFADAEVTITDDGFDPQTVKADIRETIVWTNATDADVSLRVNDPKVESGPIQPGATFSVKITKKGIYTYQTSDGSLKGRIVVGQVNAGGGGGDTDGDGGNGDGGRGDGNGNVKAKDKDVKIDRDAEALPRTGVDVTVPGLLSLLLVALGAGLLLVTQPPRRTRRLTF